MTMSNVEPIRDMVFLLSVQHLIYKTWTPPVRHVYEAAGGGGGNLMQS
jgi:hypothetical protein